MHRRSNRGERDTTDPPQEGMNRGARKSLVRRTPATGLHSRGSSRDPALTASVGNDRPEDPSLSFVITVTPGWSTSNAGDAEPKSGDAKKTTAGVLRHHRKLFLHSDLEHAGDAGDAGDAESRTFPPPAIARRWRGWGGVARFFPANR